MIRPRVGAVALASGKRGTCLRCHGDGELDAVVTYIDCSSCNGEGRTLNIYYRKGDTTYSATLTELMDLIERGKV